MAELASQRRPRDRKDQIVAAAARQFAQRGFHDTFVAGIAAEVGITASGLYRHFAGKSELLVAAIELELAQLEQAYPAPGTLDVVFDRAAEVLLQPRRVPSLWERNEQLLPPDVRAALAQRYDAATAPLRTALAAQRPDLGAADVALLAAAAHDVLDSARAYERAKVEPGRARELMVAAARSVAALPPVLADAEQLSPDRTSRGLLPASRRQAALSAAVRLFAERGFQAVGMDDIGAAAGIAGPTLYHHFPNKSAILVEVVMRCLDAMNFDLAAVLTGTDDPTVALDRALASFVRINVAQGDALAPLFTEIGNVRPEERAPIRRAQQDYVQEWAVLLAAARDDLTTAEAHALVRSSQTVVAAMRRRLPLAAAAQRAALERAGRAVLGLPGDSPRD